MLAMGEEKRNRITAAITVNAVLLVIIIVAILIAQIVQISVLKRRKRELLEEYYSIQAELDEKQDVLDRYDSDAEYREWLTKYLQMYGGEDPLGLLNTEAK